MVSAHAGLWRGQPLRARRRSRSEGGRRGVVSLELKLRRPFSLLLVVALRDPQFPVRRHGGGSLGGSMAPAAKLRGTARPSSMARSWAVGDERAKDSGALSVQRLPQKGKDVFLHLR